MLAEGTVPAATSLLSPFRGAGESPDLRGAAELWQQKAAMRMARATTETFMLVEKWLELEQARGAWKPLCCLMLRPSAAPQFMG